MWKTTCTYGRRVESAFHCEKERPPLGGFSSIHCARANRRSSNHSPRKESYCIICFLQHPSIGLAQRKQLKVSLPLSGAIDASIDYTTSVPLSLYSIAHLKQTEPIAGMCTLHLINPYAVSHRGHLSRSGERFDILAYLCHTYTDFVFTVKIRFALLGNSTCIQHILSLISLDTKAMPIEHRELAAFL